MALINFGYRVDMYAIDPPADPASFIVAYDLDGVLKQKDHLGVVTLVGAGAGGPQGPAGPVGPVGLTWSGPWIATQSYSKNYAVGYASASWWCISAVTGATSNISPDLDSAHWALLAAQGSPGSQGGTGSQGLQGAQGEIGINWIGDWIVNVYDVRDAVYYNGSSYVCIASTVGTETLSPDTNTVCWKLLASKGDIGPQGATGSQGDSYWSATGSNIINNSGASNSVVIVNNPAGGTYDLAFKTATFTDYDGQNGFGVYNGGNVGGHYFYGSWFNTPAGGGLQDFSGLTKFYINPSSPYNWISNQPINIGSGTASNSRFVVSSSGGTNSLVINEQGDAIFRGRFVVSSSTGLVSLVVDNNGNIYNYDSIYNTKFGYQSLYSNTTGYYNTALGYNSLYSNTTGYYNTALGYNSLFYNTIGSINTAIGNFSLYSNNGYYNTALGYASLYSNTTGVSNTAIGNYSLYSNTTGGNNIAIGLNSLYSNTSGVNSFGTITGGSGYIPGTYSSVQLTYLSGSTATTYPTATITVGTGGTVSRVTFVTSGTGFKDTTTVMSVGPSSVGGTGSSFSITVSSLRSGDANTAIGNYSLYYNTGDANTAIGQQSLYSNTIGNSNTAIGYYSLYSNTVGYSNTAIGYNSLGSNTVGYSNTTIGYASLYSNTTGVSNTAIGYNSLYSNTTGSYNTVLGLSALEANTTGGNNIALGNNAGQYPIAGGFGVAGSNRSIFIGVDTRPQLDNQTNQIVIGYQATGNGSNTVTLGNDSVLRTYLKGSVVIADGTQGNNYVLTSNSSGVASWSASVSVDQVSTNQLSLFDSASNNYKNIICYDSVFSFRDEYNTSVFRIENGDIRLHNSDYDVEATISPSLITNWQTYNLPDESGTIALRKYKVYTALVTQNGGGSDAPIGSGELTIGVTYRIDDNSDGLDMTNVGAADNDIGTYFVATGVDPNYWGSGTLIYNTGTPVVTVLENTIGNVWFNYVNVGVYTINLPNIVALDKIFTMCGQVQSGGDAFFSKIGPSGYDGITGLPSVTLYSLAYDLTDVNLDTESPLPIEIRVYD